MKVSIIIPAFNESAGVSQTVAALQPVLAGLRKTYEVEVVFVNDGSRDNTLVLLNEATKDDPDMRVVNHETNKGLGAAMRTGFEAVTGNVVITTDFDGTYTFDTIPVLLD